MSKTDHEHFEELSEAAKFKSLLSLESEGNRKSVSHCWISGETGVSE